MLGCGQGIGGLEVRRLEEQAAEIRFEEHYQREQQQEHPDADHILDRVVGVERNAVERHAVSAHLLLDLDAIGVVRAGAVQRHQVQHHQQQQRERQRHHMQRKEAGQRRIGNAVVAADPFHQWGADSGDGAEQVHDHLRAPERHVAPGQHVTHEGLGHQRQVHQHADQPQELAWRPVRAVQERPEHVQVDDDEERGGAGGMQVADEPAEVHLAHDVLDRVERGELAGLVEHGEEDAGQKLHDQHEQRERAEEVPEVEVLRRVVFGGVLAPLRAKRRKTRIDPLPHSDGHVYALFFSSSPITSLLSVRV